MAQIDELRCRGWIWKDDGEVVLVDNVPLWGSQYVSLLFERISPNNLWAIGTVVSTDASQLFEATIIVQAAMLLLVQPHTRFIENVKKWEGRWSECLTASVYAVRS